MLAYCTQKSVQRFNVYANDLKRELDQDHNGDGR